MLRAALDSNVLIYAEDMFGDYRRDMALDLLERISAERIIIPIQALGETLNWLIRKGKVPKAIAAAHVSSWHERFQTQATTQATMTAAMDLVSGHDFQIWDAVILAAAVEANADVLLSEDMQHGFRWRGVTIINPFSSEQHQLLTTLLAQRTIKVEHFEK